jgi:hypothetical protein
MLYRDNGEWIQEATHFQVRPSGNHGEWIRGLAQIKGESLQGSVKNQGSRARVAGCCGGCKGDCHRFTFRAPSLR